MDLTIKMTVVKARWQVSLCAIFDWYQREVRLQKGEPANLNKVSSTTPLEFFAVNIKQSFN